MNKPFSWSFSSLKAFEICPRRYQHYNVLKDVKEPETDQLRDGNRLHKAFENRLRSDEPLPMGMGRFEPMLAKIKAAPGALHLEQKLAFTREFQESAYFGPDVWFRTQIDLTRVSAGGKIASIIDWKTGKVASDTTQLQLMASAAFIHLPALERVRAALVFVNHGGAERAEFVREDLGEIWSEVLPRVRRVERARETDHYLPTPSGLCRKYCAVTSCEFHGKGGQ